MAFSHLHLHTEYSLLDGACRIKPLVSKLKKLGMTSCAITDHGALYGVVDFYEACRREGIHPVIGCEVYVCPDRHDKSTISREYSHLILLCENDQGYRNLLTLVSEGFLTGYYYKPRIDYKLLAQHSEGLIALTACLSGDLPKLLLDNRWDEARQYVSDMKAMMGPDNFYIEIMDHGYAEQKEILPRLVRLARETDTPLVATNDCHYIDSDNAYAQEVLMAIQTGKTLADENRMRHETDQLYVKSEDEMRALFPQFPDAIENTGLIAERCHVSFDFDTIHLPRFPVAEGDSAPEMLSRLCRAGLMRKYPTQDKEATDRLEYELSVINQMGYADYFLIVWDFIRHAREQGIIVGPGRGSGAGSIVAYCLDITLLDPLRYGLLFERFLNPERITMPDFDVDFCYERRQEVIDYVADKYGHDHVAQIITFGTMAARGVIRDVGRVMGYSYQDCDRVAKMVPMELNITLGKALEKNPAMAQAYESEPKVQRLIDTALLLEGMPRHAGTHAAGVLVTKSPLTDYVPLQRNDEVITTQFPMGIVEKLGLLKIDFLGLRTLTVIQDTLAMLAEQGIHMKPEDIPLDDPMVFDMIAKGDTDGVFQLEGGGMRSFLTAMMPESFEDIIAGISLYRPGPMDSIPRYIKGKQDAQSVRYVTPELAPILDVTYGCIVYQEQVMQIVRDLAGYSYGRSDLVRRAMAKKKHDVMDHERQVFIHGDEAAGVPGCVKNGISVKAAEAIFDDMASFASYAFNKSHAAAYGMVALQTAWLKLSYPHEFMAAMMNSVCGNTAKIAAYIHYCRQKGIAVLPPDINRSSVRFHVETDEGGKSIRFGLNAIKSLGEKAAEMLCQERAQRGPYKDIFDFARRAAGEAVNKRSVESLIKAGAFDRLGANRQQVMQVFEGAMDEGSASRKSRLAGQVSLFDLGTATGQPALVNHYPPVDNYSAQILLDMEKEVTGIYLSGHPLDAYTEALKAADFQCADLSDLMEGEDGGLSHDGRMVAMAGLIAGLKPKTTQRGGMMAFLTLEDVTGQIECLLFPRVYERYQEMLQSQTVLLVRGKLSIREDEEPKLLADSIRALSPSAPLTDKTAPPIPEDDQALAKRAAVKLYLSCQRGQLEEVERRLCGLKGDVPVFLYLNEEKRTLLAPRDCWAQDAGIAKTLLSDLLPDNNMKVVHQQ